MPNPANSTEALVAPAAYARTRRNSSRSRRRWWIIGSAVIVLGLTAFGMRASGWIDRLLGRETAMLAYHEVKPETLSITLTEDGELKPVESAEIKCEVEGQSTILFVVEESTRVEKGDLLVELASDTLVDRLESEQMELRRIQADFESAKEELALQVSQNESNIKKAQIDLEVAQLDLLKYTKGDFEGALKDINVQIQQSELDIARKTRELEEYRGLLEKNWVNRNEVDEKEFALTVAQLQLDRHRLSKEILLEYERPKILKQRESAVARAIEELEREKARAASREKKQQSRVAQYKDQLQQRERRVERVETQLAKCKMVAPVAGVVQYPNDGGWRWSGTRIASGEKVFEGQTLVVLPDTSSMVVTTRIHEADRHMIGDGMECVVKVPAVPGETFSGHITKIDKYADSENRWLNPDLKEHGAEILLEGYDAELSPGDTAEVTILIGTVEDCLAVPIQCVFSRGRQSFVFVQSGGSSEPVEVALGRANAQLVEITEGLNNGQQVAMHATEEMLAMLPAIDSANPAPETPVAEKPAVTTAKKVDAEEAKTEETKTEVAEAEPEASEQKDSATAASGGGTPAHTGR